MYIHNTRAKPIRRKDPRSEKGSLRAVCQGFDLACFGGEREESWWEVARKLQAMFVRPLVSPSWLQRSLRAGVPPIVVLDGTWHMPFLKRNALAEFEAKRIKGARFFDIDLVADRSTTLPHMLPSPEVFAEHVGAMGISNDTYVVIYDAAQSIGAAARVLWTFRVFGHQGGVSVLEGGLCAWQREGFEVVGGKLGSVEDEEFPIEPKKYIPRLNGHLVKSFDEIISNLNSPSELVVDARPSSRFLGIDPEPRPGLSSGHMPGSVSLPHAKLLDVENHGVMLRGKALADAFENAGVKISERAVHSCGSGVNASITWLGTILARSEMKPGAWEELEDGLSVYDGSWTEYAGRIVDGAKIEK
ncbi:Rhodanese-like domain-containing protein [Chytriomyces sp. MP71]|nr:Rhodanese-like domain-containing protein [Chytriomyces sp. MP71]